MRSAGEQAILRLSILRCVSALTLVRSGHPNDALKCFQFGQFSLRGVQPGKSTPAIPRTDDPRIPTLAGRLNRNSATAYALMDHPEQAKRSLAEAQDGWAPRDAFEQAGADFTTAKIQLDLRQFGTAESFAASAVRTYGEAHGRGRTSAKLVLAEVHVRAGEPRGLALARQAIEEVNSLQSVAVRQERFVPLATALEARPGRSPQRGCSRHRTERALPATQDHRQLVPP